MRPPTNLLAIGPAHRLERGGTPDAIPSALGLCDSAVVARPADEGSASGLSVCVGSAPRSGHAVGDPLACDGEALVPVQRGVCDGT